MANPACHPPRPAVHCSGTTRKVCLGTGLACTLGSSTGEQVKLCSASAPTGTQSTSTKCYSAVKVSTVTYAFKVATNTAPAVGGVECLSACATGRPYCVHCGGTSGKRLLCVQNGVACKVRAPVGCSTAQLGGRHSLQASLAGNTLCVPFHPPSRRWAPRRSSSAAARRWRARGCGRTPQPAAAIAM